MEVKKQPGIRTTEFWVTILAVIGAATLGLTEVVPPQIAAILGSVSTMAYAISRGLAKKQ